MLFPEAFKSAFKTVPQFFAWWMRELWALVPGFLRTLVCGRARRLEILVREHDAVFRDSKRNGHDESDGVTLELDPEDQTYPGTQFGRRGEVKKILRRLSFDRDDVSVRIPTGNILSCEISLPEAVEGNLREVLKFEMDRHTPFSEEQVYFSHRILRHQAGRIFVWLSVVSRTDVDRAISLVKSWGLEPAQVIATDETLRDSLLPVPHLRQSGFGFGGAFILLSMMLTLLLIAVNAFLPYVAMDERLALGKERLEKVRAEAQVATVLSEQIEEELARSTFLAAEKLNNPLQIEVLREITHLLPDHTWIVLLRINNGQVLLSGLTRDAAPLIALLQTSEILDEVAFSSPVTADQRTGMNRFNIKATITGREPQKS